MEEKNVKEDTSPEISISVLLSSFLFAYMRACVLACLLACVYTYTPMRCFTFHIYITRAAADQNLQSNIIIFEADRCAPQTHS